jgi:hypothetical protein
MTMVEVKTHARVCSDGKEKKGLRDNTEMYLKVTGLNIMDCINVGQDNDKWSILMNVVMNMNVLS